MITYFKLEDDIFCDNMKVLFGHLYTCWTSEGMDISRRLTKW